MQRHCQGLLIDHLPRLLMLTGKGGTVFVFRLDIEPLSLVFGYFHPYFTKDRCNGFNLAFKDIALLYLPPQPQRRCFPKEGLDTGGLNTGGHSTVSNTPKRDFFIVMGW